MESALNAATCKSGTNLMPVRKRFRIEEAIAFDVPMPPEIDAEMSALHREIMNELRAIRAQMGAPRPGGAAKEANGDSVPREVADAHAMLETYRAQIEQCEKLKAELDLIYDAITRTK